MKTSNQSPGNVGSFPAAEMSLAVTECEQHQLSLEINMRNEVMQQTEVMFPIFQVAVLQRSVSIFNNLQKKTINVFRSCRISEELLVLVSRRRFFSVQIWSLVM